MVTPLCDLPRRVDLTSSSSVTSTFLDFLLSELAQPNTWMRSARRWDMTLLPGGFKKSGWKKSWLLCGCSGTKTGRSGNSEKRWATRGRYWRSPTPSPWRKTIGRGDVSGSHCSGIRSKYLGGSWVGLFCGDRSSERLTQSHRKMRIGHSIMTCISVAGHNLRRRWIHRKTKAVVEFPYGPCRLALVE